jgi:hypothetical protein
MGRAALGEALHAIQSNLVPVFRIVPAWNVDLGKHQVWWIT